MTLFATRRKLATLVVGLMGFLAASDAAESFASRTSAR